MSKGRIVARPQMIDALPAIYDRFLPELFQQTIPREVLATCSDCAMVCKKKDLKLPGIRYFSPDTKCCTYHPYLPNFLVGGLLADANAGGGRIHQKVLDRVGVTPFGIFAPREFSALYIRYQQLATDTFDLAKSMLCPYYDSHNGNCTVWKFRDAVCATYFCKPVAGVLGEIFWNHFRDYMLYVQDMLTLYVLKKLNWDPEVIKQLKVRKQHGSANLCELTQDQYLTAWGHWAGKEEEFFVHAYRIVNDLAPDKFPILLGAKGKSLLQKIQTAKVQMLHPTIPTLLRRNPQLQVHKRRQSYILSTDMGVYSSSLETYEVLDLFDGVRTSGQVIRMVRETKRRRFPKNLLIDLYRQRILIPA